MVFLRSTTDWTWPRLLSSVARSIVAFIETPESGTFEEVEYAPGAGIGWHRDRPVFGDVVGISLLAPARLRFRRKRGAKWERAALWAEPCSAYLLRGPARREWEHSIAPMDRLRYSITFRTMAA
jgi:alkylated DNA repair dioxygenase AlkB